jgi:N-acetylneuraminic acid mutarotase
VRPRQRTVLVVCVSILATTAPPIAALGAASLGVEGPAAAAATPQGTWTTDEPSGLKRQEVTYVTVGSKIYLAGGRSPVQQAFDPVAHTWQTVAPLPESLDHIGAVALNGKIYYVGGLNGYPNGASFGNVYVYNPATNSVSSAASLPAGRDRGAAGIAVYQGKIYLAGGFHAGASVGFFDVYDPATNSWSSLPDLPEKRDHVAAAVIGSRMYVIGGRTYGHSVQPQNDAFDFTTGKWVTGLAPIPTLRAGSATAVLGTEILVIGGECCGSAYNQVEAYDTATNTWRELTPMPTARHGIMAAPFNGSFYIADGGTRMGGGGQTDIQEVLTVSGSPPPPTGRPDCRVRLSSETKLIGNNVYNTTGAGQTRAVTSSVATTTFVLSLQNDATTADALAVHGPGSAGPFTLKYLAGTSGTTDITAAVVAGTYRTANLAAGGLKAIRLQVTVAGGTAAGTTSTWLPTVTSVAASTAVDACGAKLTVG